MNLETISHYRIISKLGAGGMGEVYLAEDLNLGRQVALKLLPAKFMQDRERVRRFEQEARAASKLSHPNILTIYEIGEGNGTHFIAMEYVEGQTLRRRMAGGRLPVDQALELAGQIAGALVAAHGAGITHRDIKPENVMVREDGLVKVLDFGLAKLTEKSSSQAHDLMVTRGDSDEENLSDLYATISPDTQADTSPGVIVGTISYMSPEQARGLKIDARTDIFSLGIVLYEMVAGRPPFEGKTTGDMMVSILDRHPPPLARLAPNIPEALEWIVAKSLAKDREERYQSTKSLLADVKRLQKRLEFEANYQQRAESSTETSLNSSLSSSSLSGGSHPGRKQTVVERGEVALLSQTISHYRILNHLGTSVLGEVYLAEDTHLGRKVALTVLPEQFTRDVDRMQRLAREARVLSALNHPNIRMIYEVGQDQTRHYLATEFVEGPTLRAYLSYTRMRLEEVLDVALQLATGLAAAHSAGVLHRDLKPENIMLRPDGYVKILDFGLAKVAEQDSMLVDLSAAPVKLAELVESTESLAGESSSQVAGEVAEIADANTAEVSLDEVGPDPYRTRPLGAEHSSLLVGGARMETGLWWMAGTPGYLSPEQVRGEPVDERSDIFSLGVVLYEMCTSRLPFEGQTATGVLSSILQKTPTPIRRLMPEAPEELEWIVEKALAKDCEDRYQTAREWLNDLKRLKQRLEFEAEQAQRESSSRGDVGRATRAGEESFYGTSPIIQETEARRRSGRRSGRHSGRGTTGLTSHSGSSRVRGEAIDSIAVLPLVNSGNDPNAEYLCDGITEGVISALSRLPGLRVMARSTVFRYKGRQVDPLEVGDELGVRAVFIGRLLQRGESIVIKAELVDAFDGALLWSEQYQRQTGDLFEFEADIAKQISEHLRIQLSGEQQAGLARRYTDDPIAYDLYLKGRFFWNMRSPQAMKKAIEYFVQAIKRDAGYALAYSGLADCYTLLSWYAVPPREFVPKARLSVTRALEIDEQLAEAHASLGFLTLWYDWDFPKAEQEFLRAIELNPNYSTGHHWYSYCLMVMERFDEAKEQIERALALDPLSLIIITDIGEQLYRRRRYDEAMAQFQNALDLDPEFALANYWMLRMWVDSGKVDQTIAALEALPKVEGRHGGSAILAVAYARAGRPADAQKSLAELLELHETQYVPPYYLALIESNLGNNDQAFVWLEKAYQERSGWMPWLKQDPMSDRLRADPRFDEMVRRVGLTP